MATDLLPFASLPPHALIMWLLRRRGRLLGLTAARLLATLRRLSPRTVPMMISVLGAALAIVLARRVRRNGCPIEGPDARLRLEEASAEVSQISAEVGAEVQTSAPEHQSSDVRKVSQISAEAEAEVQTSSPEHQSSDVPKVSQISAEAAAEVQTSAPEHQSSDVRKVSTIVATPFGRRRISQRIVPSGFTWEISSSVPRNVRDAEKQHIVHCMEQLRAELTNYGGLDRYLADNAEFDESSTTTLQKLVETVLLESSQAASTNLTVHPGNMLFSMGGKKVVTLKLSLDSIIDCMVSVCWSWDCELKARPNHVYKLAHI